MNTPITDAAWYHNADHVPAVDADLARLLETDRAALIEIVENYVENGHSRGLASRATEALAAARANFPQP